MEKLDVKLAALKDPFYKLQKIIKYLFIKNINFIINKKFGIETKQHFCQEPIQNL
jgi:hypothetical protein